MFSQKMFKIFITATIIMLLYNTSGRLLLNLCIMSHRGNHWSVLYYKISVFYALKYPKLTTLSFYPSGWQPNPRLTSPNCTTSSWLHALFNGIFTHVTITTIISSTNMKARKALEYEVYNKIDMFLKTLI